MNATATDAQLLRGFAEERSDDAFTELVRRHIDSVFTAAARRTGGDAAAAQDIAQTVFTGLATKLRGAGAAEVLQVASLGGWLHRQTGFTAATYVRGEARRRTREQTSMELRSQADTTDWSSVAPVLDEALDGLPDGDRDAIALRFLERRPFAGIGAVFGVSEDAARMRVDRALDKLRTGLARRGITSTAAALGTALGQHAVGAAPAGFASDLSAAALCGAATSFTTSPHIILMPAEKPKLIGLSVAVAVAVSMLILQRSANSRLRNELARTSDELGRARATVPVPPSADPKELERLRGEHLELLRLRGEVAGLRRTASHETGAATLETVAEPVEPRPVQVVLETRFFEIDAASHGKLGTILPLWTPVLMGSTQVSGLVEAIERQAGRVSIVAPGVLTMSGQQCQVSATDGDEFEGPAMIATPRVADGSESVFLEMRAGYLIPERVDYHATNDSPRVLPFSPCTVSVGPRQSVVVCGFNPDDIRVDQKTGLPRLLDPAVYGRRYLVTIVTPTCVDQTGHVLFPQAPGEGFAPKTDSEPSPKSAKD